MTSSQGVHDAGFTALPPELIIAIASHLPRPDLARLSRVSSFYRSVCVKRLYMEVEDHVIVWPEHGIVHLRPPLNNPDYAKHVRCLQVSARPEGCCRLPPFTLPHLDVLRVQFGSQYHIYGDGAPEFASADAYTPRTLVMELPNDPYFSDFPMSYLTSRMKSTQLVLLLRNFGFADAAVSNFTPRCTRTVTIVVLLRGRQCTLERLVTALMSICLRLANQDCTPFKYHQLQHVRFVIGGMTLSRACYDQLLRSLLKHIKRYSYYTGPDVPAQYAAPDSASTTAKDAPRLPRGSSEDGTPYDYADRSQRPPPTIEILSMDEYLSLGSSRYVLSEDDLKDHREQVAEHVFDDAGAVAKIKKQVEEYQHVGMIMRPMESDLSGPDGNDD